MTNKQTLSVIIITYNEAHDIGDCLDSVRWADEIIVLDSGSQDKTVEICKTYTDKVWVVDWPGYGKQKNRALSYAQCDWVLSLDADEQVSDALRQEIQAVLSTPRDTASAAYSVPRPSTYCGQRVRYGDWRTDRCIRLFQRGQGVFKDVAVHEAVLVDGHVQALQGALWHRTYRDLSEVLEKLNQYSTLGALMRQEAGDQSSLFKAITHGLWAFFRSYFLRLGFLDGRVGFMLAFSNAEGTYYRYLKIMNWS